MAKIELPQRIDDLRSIAAALDAVPEGVAVVDASLRIRYANRALCEILECEKPEALVDCAAVDFLTEEAISRLSEYAERLLAAGHIEFETTAKTARGRTILVEVASSLLRDGWGGPHCFIVIIRDISGRKRAEEELRHSRETLRAVVENVGLGIAVMSPQMEILELNRTLREWFPQIDVTQRPICYGAFNNPPRAGPCTYCPTIKTLQDGQVHEAVTETPTPDGVCNYRIISTALRDAEGDLVGAIEIVEDVTEKKRAQEALQQSEREYRTLTEISNDAMVAIGKDGLITLFNPAAERMFGWRAAEMLGQPLDRMLPIQYRSAHREYVRSYFEHGSPNGAIGRRIELPAVRRNGEELTVELSLSATARSGHPLVLAILRDVTERKKAQKALEAKNRELESFVYTASHDLRSPLVGIEGFARLLTEDYLDKLDPQGQEYLHHIEANATNMNSLLTDLLELSRIGRVEEKKEEVPAAEAVTKALESQAEIIQRLGATVKVADDLPAVRYCRSRLYEVFSNLISNAVKFSREEVPPRVEIDWEHNDSCYRFLVKDNGIGIAEDDAQIIFEIFSRLKEKDVEGTGIGLAIVKRIVEEHGGQVGVESTPGEGSTFWFTVPAGQEP